MSEETSSKSPADIIILEQKVDTQTRQVLDNNTKQVILQNKIDQYMRSRLCPKSYVLSMVVQLMTRGKIRVEFTDFAERLELKYPSDMIMRQNIGDWLDEYLREFTMSEDKTSRIIIQRIKDES